jgi:type I restriction enzyme S subunit
MGHIQRHHLSSAMCVVPPEELTTALSSLFMPILDSIISLNLQIRSLKKTRDALLPRLLSGEIDVSDAERFAGAAL